MAKVKLDEVVSSLLNEMDSSVHTRRRLFDIGVDVLRTLNMDVKGRIRTTIITVNSNQTLSYPHDYINWIKIGVPNASGEIATFSKNKQLSLYNTDGNRSVTVPTTPDDWSIYNEYRNYNLDGSMYNLFGLGGDSPIAKFREDDENMCFAFEATFPYNEVVLEYLSNQIDDDGEFWVDERIEDAVKAGIYHRAIRRLKNIPIYEKKEAEREWIKQKRMAKARVNPFRLSEANDVTRKTIKLALKH